MYKITLKDDESGRPLLEFDMPEIPEEILFRDFCGWNAAFQAHNDWLIEITNDEETPFDPNEMGFRVKYLRSISHILSEYLGGKPLIDVPVGNINQHLLTMFGGEMEVDIEAADKTLTALYTKIWAVIMDFKPTPPSGEDCYFVHEQVKYKIPGYYMDAFTKKKVFDKIPLGQSVEAMEVVRAWENNIPKDIDGSIYYSSMLKMIAIFARKVIKSKPEKLEPFPVEEDEVAEFIQKRWLDFEDISMTTARNIEAFFLRGIKA